MLIIAMFGVLINSLATYFTKGGSSLNQKAVNLHMLEDVLGWIVVLVGAVLMKFTDLYIIDPIMSIGVAVFILVNAVKNLKEVLELFLEKAPHNVNVHELKEHLCKIEGVLDVHHIHVWSMDGHTGYATMHVVTNGEAHEIKRLVREELKEHGIAHATLELESEGEHCHEEHCHIEPSSPSDHHHHHHHH
jgi:cobalt-zinc-cadmium efflux system protein